VLSSADDGHAPSICAKLIISSVQKYYATHMRPIEGSRSVSVEPEARIDSLHCPSMHRLRQKVHDSLIEGFDECAIC